MVSHWPHKAVFGHVLTGEEREEVVQQWVQVQALVTELLSDLDPRLIIMLSVKYYKSS